MPQSNNYVVFNRYIELNSNAAVAPNTARSQVRDTGNYTLAPTIGQEATSHAMEGVEDCFQSTHDLFSRDYLNACPRRVAALKQHWRQRSLQEFPDNSW